MRASNITGSQFNPEASPVRTAPSVGSRLSAAVARRVNNVRQHFASGPRPSVNQPPGRGRSGVMASAGPARGISAPVPIRESAHFALIGVAGAMGTEAGIDTASNIMRAGVQKLRELGAAVNDQALPPFNLMSDAPGIPDRTAFLKKKDIAGMKSQAEKDEALQSADIDNPLWGMQREISALRESGARVYVVPCNTAHAWAKFFPDAAQGMEHVHIVDAAIAQAAKNQAIKAKMDSGQTVRLGLMATDGTVGNRIYQERLKELAAVRPEYANVEFVTPDAVHQAEVMTGIYDANDGVKSGNKDRSTAHFHKAADHLKEQEVDALVQACTEIPIGMPGATYEGTPIVNPNTALAEAVIERAYALRQEEIAQENARSGAQGGNAKEG